MGGCLECVPGCRFRNTSIICPQAMKGGSSTDSSGGKIMGVVSNSFNNQAERLGGGIFGSVLIMEVGEGRGPTSFYPPTSFLP